MLYKLITALALLATPTPGVAQTVTSAVHLADSSPESPGLVVNKAVTDPQVKKGTTLFDCGSKASPFVYGVGSADACPKVEVAKAPAIVAPVVTSAPKDFGSSGQISYGAAKNVNAVRALNAFPLRKGGILIEDVIADNVNMFVVPEKAKATTLNDVGVNRVDVKVKKRGIFLRGDSARWDIGNFRINYVGPVENGDFPMGIQLGMNHTETVHDIVIHDGFIGGFRSALPVEYPNADGIDCERKVYNVVIRNVTIQNVTDGGIDCKATAVTIDNVKVESAGRSYRLWGTGTGTTVTSINPRKAHIWLGASSNYTIDKLVAVGGGILIDVGDKSAVLTVKSCDLSGYIGGVLIKANNGKIKLDASCKL